jgi:hypothetical protein
MEPQEFELFKNRTYLANLCNSTIVEIYFDIIRVSQRFRGCQMLEYIAESNTSALKTGNYDIINFDAF